MWLSLLPVELNWYGMHVLHLYRESRECDMGSVNPNLQSVYNELLKEHGLDQIENSVESTREAFDAMANAGWYDIWNVDRDQAWEEMVRDSKNVAYAFNPILASIAAEVEDDIRLRGGTIPCSVFVGGFPIGETNACIKLVTDGALILFNQGLMNLIYQIGKVFVLSYDWLCAGTTDEGDVEVLVTDDKAPPVETMTATLGWETCGWTRQNTINALTGILHAYVRDGTVNSAPRQPLSTTRDRVMTYATLVHYAERFVVAHEYAHLVLGHCEDSVADLATPVGTLSSVFSRSREQEFEADELAMSLLLVSSDWTSPGGEFDVNARVAGIALSFASLVFVAVALEGPIGFSLDPASSDTHPTPSARMMRMVEFLHRRYGRSGSQLARVCMGWVLANIEEVISGIACLSQASRLQDSAQAFYDQQQYADATPLFRRVIALREAALGKSDLSIAAPLSNLANCITHFGQLEEAEELLSRSLAICEDSGSAAATYLVTILNNLASHYAKVGKHEKAEPLFRRSLELAEAQLAQDSSAFAICVHNYLGMLDELKRDGDMEDLCKHSIAITRRTLGEEHRDYSINLNRLATLYQLANRYSEAIPLAEEIVAIARRQFGKQHPEFANALNNVAYLYMYVGRLEEAESLYDQVLRIGRSSVGESHPDFARGLNNLGLLYEAANRWKEAEQAFQQAVDIMAFAVGADDLDTKKSLGNLKRVLKRIAAGD